MDSDYKFHKVACKECDSNMQRAIGQSKDSQHLKGQTFRLCKMHAEIKYIEAFYDEQLRDIRNQKLLTPLLKKHSDELEAHTIVRNHAQAMDRVESWNSNQCTCLSSGCVPSLDLGSSGSSLRRARSRRERKSKRSDEYSNAEGRAKLLYWNEDFGRKTSNESLTTTVEARTGSRGSVSKESELLDIDLKQYINNSKDKMNKYEEYLLSKSEKNMELRDKSFVNTSSKTINVQNKTPPKSKEESPNLDEEFKKHVKDFVNKIFFEPIAGRIRRMYEKQLKDKMTLMEELDEVPQKLFMMLEAEGKWDEFKKK